VSLGSANFIRLKTCRYKPKIEDKVSGNGVGTMHKENRATISPEFPLEVMEQSANEDNGIVYSEPHWHELGELLIVQEGELLLYLGDNAISMRQGDICLVNQYGIHSTRSGQAPMRGYVIFFDPSLLLNSKSIHEDERKIEAMISGDRCFYLPNQPSDPIYQEVSSAIHQAIDQMLEAEPGYVLFAKAYLLSFLGYMVRYQERFLPIINPNQRQQRERLDTILQYMEYNYPNKITLKQIAATINVSPYRFCHVFRELTGQSFTQYLVHFRVVKSQEMLIREQKNITEIALNCGFNNISYFNHIFKRTTGYTPGQFRKRSPHSTN
jgi:AraC family transcriptional activator of pobA